MTIRIHLFARFKELLGTSALTMDAPPGATVGDLKRLLSERNANVRGLLAASAVAVDEEFAEDALVIREDAVVALIPPVSGG